MKENVLKIGEYLISLDLLTQKQLDYALKIQESTNEKIGQIILREGLVDEKPFTTALAKYFNLPIATRDQLDVNNPIIQKIPMAIALKGNFVPFQYDNEKGLLIASYQHVPQNVCNNLKRFVNTNVTPHIMCLTDFNFVFKQLYSEKEKADDLQVKTSTHGSAVSFLEEILELSIKLNASDIHVEPQEDTLEIRMRVDGVLKKVLRLSSEYGALIVSRIKVLSNLNIAEKRIPQDGSFLFEAKTEKTKLINIRVSTLPRPQGEKAVLRIMKSEKNVTTINQIGFEPDMMEVVKNNIFAPFGMILVTGPTGSGKSTSMYSFLQEIIDERLNIVSIEDPIEIKMRGINQTQVDVSCKYTFATALRAILRQDPDVIMIGEIRDDETASLAIKSALTGHLVLSTLHTNDAVSAFNRLAQMGIPNHLIASAVRLVIAQKLVRKNCPQCRRTIEDHELQQANLLLKTKFDEKSLMIGKGCAYCNEIGYIGRTGIFEIIEMNETVRQMLENNMTTSDIRNYYRSQASLSLREHGLLKLKRGETSYSEVLKATLI